VVRANLLEGPEHASSLRCKCITQHARKPQLQGQKMGGWGRGQGQQVGS
jgi:hypothetical protein